MPQEPRLLHASVADNIRYFRDLDHEQVERAAKLARIHEDIISWPHGYETIVGPRVDAVSGGQQQRICLAGRWQAGPQVLVLDEPTSALDPTRSALIQDRCRRCKHELTLFIIAHRMSTLDICDRVMVISTAAWWRSTLARSPADQQRLLPLGVAAGRRQHRWRRVVRRAGGVQDATEPPGPAERAARLARTGRSPHVLPTSSSSASQERDDGAVRDAPRPPADLHARQQGAVVLRRGAAGAHASAAGRHPAHARRSTWRLFADAAPEQRTGEASALYLWSRTAAGASRRSRPHARIIAILREPASLLRSLHLQFLESYVETEPDLAGRSRSSPTGARVAASPATPTGRSALLYSEHVRYVEQLRRYREHFPPSTCWSDLRRLPRRQRRRRVRSVLRFLGWTTPRRSSCARPIRRSGALPAPERAHPCRVRWGVVPLSRAIKSSSRRVTPRVCAASGSRRRSDRVALRDPAPGRRGPHARAASPLQGARCVALSEYLERDLVALWGYDALG